MSGQGELFDLPTGEQWRDVGLAQAEEADRVQHWRDDALRALDDLAATGVPFTADDLIELVGLPDSGVNRNNAVGALIRGAGQRGLIVKVGHRKSTRAAAHARTVAVWRGAGHTDPTKERKTA